MPEELPFTIEVDETAAGRYFKRDLSTGLVETATITDFLLFKIWEKVSGGQPAPVPATEPETETSSSSKRK